jgi:hypothetical protein
MKTTVSALLVLVSTTVLASEPPLVSDKVACMEESFDAGETWTDVYRITATPWVQ